MSNNDEKMKVLSMLQEGKITADEAARLLEALDGGTTEKFEYQGSSKQKQGDFYDEVNKTRDKINSWMKDVKGNFNQKDFDKVVEDVATKAEKVGKNVAVVTVGAVDRLLDYVGTFVDTSLFNVFSNYKAVEKIYEATAYEGQNIHIEGLNGTIVVKKHLDDRIIIRSKIRSASDNVEGFLQFEENAENITLKVNNPSNFSASHEIYVPQTLFGAIKLTTANAKIYAEDVRSKSFDVTTRNSHIELMGITADEVKAETKNGRLQLNYVIGGKIDVNTNNSLVEIRHVKTGELNAATTNGRVLVENMQNIEGRDEATVNLKTTNGGIKVYMNDMENRAYKVRGRTTNGAINLLIPELTYHNVNRFTSAGSFVEAESLGYDTSIKRVSINVETNNGGIEISQ